MIRLPNLCSAIRATLGQRQFRQSPGLALNAHSGNEWGKIPVLTGYAHSPDGRGSVRDVAVLVGLNIICIQLGEQSMRGKVYAIVLRLLCYCVACIVPLCCVYCAASTILLCFVYCAIFLIYCAAFLLFTGVS